MADTEEPLGRSLRYWNKHAGSYDKQMGFFDRVLFKDTRAWICRQAQGAVASTSWAPRIVQRGLELITIPLGGEHFLRRPSKHLPAAGFEIEHRQRFTAGIVERLAARKPDRNSS